MVQGQFPQTGVDELEAKTGFLEQSLDADAVLQSDSNSTDSAASAVLTPGRSWSPQWLLIQLGVCVSLGGLAALAFLSLTALPPATDCKAISPLSPDVDRLHCAQIAAESGKLPEIVAGLKLVENWTPDHPLYSQAQQWIGKWSEATLIAAHEKMRQSDLKGAVNLANQIPPSSPTYKEAQATIAKWKNQWQAGQAVYNEARVAIKKQNWEQAYAKMRELNEMNSDYWRVQQSAALSQQILLEKQARSSLVKARQMAATKQPEQLGQAIALVSQINHKTFAWSEIQTELNRWSETLLKVGLQQWQARQVEQAIALADKVSLNPNLSWEAKNLIALSQARKLAMAGDSNWQVTGKQFWNLLGAIATAYQIKPESRFYTQAQSSLTSWKAQLQDVTQLQLAQLTAGLSQREALEMAIAQAKQVELKRPRRLQAQTLIAHWTNEIERQEDRPILEAAQRLAEPGTIPDLRAAIAEANRIPTGRVLRGEAQGLAYGWRRQIEVLEDKPLLNLARLQASQGQLESAIRTASVIRPGRALYWQAQAAIGDWQSEIQRIAREKAAKEAAIAARKAKEQEDKLKLEFSNPTESDDSVSTELPPALQPDSRTKPNDLTSTPGNVIPSFPKPAQSDNKMPLPVEVAPTPAVELSPTEAPAKPLEAAPANMNGAHQVETVPML